MSTFMLEVLVPGETLYWGRAISLTADAIDGEVQVLSGHIPYVNILAPGKIRLKNDEGNFLHFEHSGGILEVAREKTSVLVYPLKEKK
jgi:F-type H+-transporting ATPase subunit epsilon